MRHNYDNICEYENNIHSRSEPWTNGVTLLPILWYLFVWVSLMRLISILYLVNCAHNYIVLIDSQTNMLSQLQIKDNLYENLLTVTDLTACKVPCLARRELVYVWKNKYIYTKRKIKRTQLSLVTYLLGKMINITYMRGKNMWTFALSMTSLFSNNCN